MKRSDVVKLISSWAKPEILADVYSCNHEEWADNLLYTLENDVGMLPPKTEHYGPDWDTDGSEGYNTYEWETE